MAKYSCNVCGTDSNSTEACCSNCGSSQFDVEFEFNGKRILVEPTGDVLQWNGVAHFVTSFDISDADLTEIRALAANM